MSAASLVDGEHCPTCGMPQASEEARRRALELCCTGAFTPEEREAAHREHARVLLEDVHSARWSHGDAERRLKEALERATRAERRFEEAVEWGAMLLAREKTP